MVDALQPEHQRVEIVDPAPDPAARAETADLAARTARATFARPVPIGRIEYVRAVSW